MMKKMLELHGKFLGQKINWLKLEIFFFNVPIRKNLNINRILNIK